MIRAILRGLKTEFRIPIRNPPAPDPTGRWTFIMCSSASNSRNCFNYSVLDPKGSAITDRGRERGIYLSRCPFGLAGDRLGIREAYQAVREIRDPETGRVEEIPHYTIRYRSTDPQGSESSEDRGFGWRPATQMPRWACRIWLPILSIRVEPARLDLSELEESRVVAEGFRQEADGLWRLPGDPGHPTAQAAYRAWWNGQYKKIPPWVWVIRTAPFEGKT